MLNMDWETVEEILYDGKKEQINAVRCPDCGGTIYFTFSDECDSIEIGCKHCGRISRGYKSPVPNCVRYFGLKYDWNDAEE